MHGQQNIKKQVCMS